MIPGQGKPRLCSCAEQSGLRHAGTPLFCCQRQKGVSATKLCGLQKLTLLDYPGLTACTVFTGGCNLRCPFCHNASLVLRPQECSGLHPDEVLEFLTKRRRVLDGVCVTGGEPLLQPDLEDFLRRIRALGLRVKLDTNGCFPVQLAHLVEQGLADYVAMDLKNSPALYPATVGVSDFDLAPVRESAAYLLGGRVEYEFRTTVVRGLHTAASLVEAARWIKGAQRYYLQQFVDSGDLIGAGLSGFDPETMRGFLNRVTPFVTHAGLRGV